MTAAVLVLSALSAAEAWTQEGLVEEVRVRSPALERGGVPHGRGDASTAGRPTPLSTIRGDTVQDATAEGWFEVELAEQPSGPDVGRMSLRKEYHGDLEATAEGEMLTWRHEDAGTAAYVAIERVTGVLDGREGSFVLTHRGAMTPDRQRLTVSVVPGSGTGDLAGLSGTMTIEITDGKHLYEFRYELSGGG